MMNMSMVLAISLATIGCSPIRMIKNILPIRIPRNCILFMVQKHEMNKAGTFLTVVFAILLTGTLTSCTDFIDPSAANSLAAVLAVIGEYLYAIIVLALLVILWILRPAGIALTLLGVLGLCKVVELSVNSTLLACIGILLIFASFVPIKQYEPLVVISKHFKMPKKEKVKEKHNTYKNILIQILVGTAMLIIEYSIFVK